MNATELQQLSVIEKRANLTLEEFVENYAMKRKPVVLTGMINHWKAMQEWSYDYFQTKYASTTVTIHKCTPPSNLEFYETTLGEYIDYLKAGEFEDDPWYCDWSFMEDCPEILEEYDEITFFKGNLLNYIPRGNLNDTRWIFMGPAGTGTPLHVDFAMTSAWNAVINGQKKWAFFSPDQTPYMYDGMVNVFNPDMDKFPLFSKAKPIYVTQNPGEIMYAPTGWWHQVLNVKGGISISENFINETNVETALWPYVKMVVNKNGWDLNK